MPITPLTPLIGREQSVKEVSTLLLRPEVRLLTLTGAGGIGKTRIALQVINEVQQGFADGCYFIPLASITEPDLVPYTMMRFLDAPMRKDLAVSKQLQAHLQAKNALLVLDNFEHLIPATPLVTALLAACPTIKLLITSRVSLHLSGEREIAVPPLALPELGALPELAKLSAVDSIALFVQRAGAVKRDFRLTPGNARSIAEICTRLDGLPLALELAAARIKLLSPQALLIRLDSRLDLLNGGGPDLPVRHQALRNTLDWSYQLLNTEEQLLFQRLAVFVGGCTSEAVAALYTTLDGNAPALLHLMRSLVDSSLLQQVQSAQDEPRFIMLETIREYALERLKANREEERCRNAHASYYLSLVERAEAAFVVAQQAPWLRRFSLPQEQGNVAAACYWLNNHQEMEALLRLVSALGQFWLLRGEIGVGRHFLELALTASRAHYASVADTVKAKVLYTVGWFAHWLADEEAALAYATEALALSRNLGDKRMLAGALNLLGTIECNHQGNLERGKAMLGESLRLQHELGDTVSAANTLLALISQSLFHGAFEQAVAFCKEGLTLAKTIHDTWRIATHLHLMGWIAYAQQNYTAARAFTEESVATFKSLGRPTFLTEALVLLAYERWVLGDKTTPPALLEASLTYAKEAEHAVDIAIAVCSQGYLALQQHELATARSLFEQSLTMMKSMWAFSSLIAKGKWICACSLEGLGQIAFAQQQTRWAVLLLSVAQRVRTAKGYTLPLGMLPFSADALLASARTQLRGTDVAATWAVGQAMTIERVLAAEESSSPPSQLAKAVEEIPSLTSLFSQPHRLTEREMEVLALIVQSFTNHQIATTLKIRTSTVSTHVQSIYAKLGVTSRSAATRYALEHHLT